MASTSGSSNGANAYENVQVVVRMRPMSAAEIIEKKPAAVRVEGSNTIRIAGDHLKKKDGQFSLLLGNQQAVSYDKTWAYDRVYDSKTAQAELFNTSVAPVVDEVLRGYSCTVFAYGQTGTGKTHTMEGAKGADGLVDAESEQAGVIPRAVQRVFDSLESRFPDKADSGEYAVKISFLEIYNEKLDDLLSMEPSTFHAANDGEGGGGAMAMGGMGGRGGGAPGKQGSTAGGMGGAATAPGSSGDSGLPGHASSELRIVGEVGGSGGVKVQGLEEVQVKGPKECFEWLKRGVSKRATAETKCNAQSSRSHCVFSLTITTKEVFDGQDVFRVGKLNLVDLAGSECVGRSGATDKRAREAGNINQSLLTLGRVISALVDKAGHVPYRDSKLTRLLQDSLGGKTKTCMIATVSPALANAEETVSTLEYAARAKRIQNRPEAMARMERREITSAALKELDKVRAQLRAQLDKSGGYMQVLETEWADLNAQKVALEEAAEQAGADKVEVQEQLDATTRALEGTRQALEESRAAHTATQARLSETEVRLEAARAALASETAAREDAEAVIRGQGAVEAHLLHQAAGVKDQLQAAASDASGLHAKVARVSRTMAGNKAAAESHASSTAGRLAGLLASAEAFSAEQAGRAGALRSSATSFASSSSADTAGVLATLAKLKGEAVGYAKSVTAGASSLSEDVGSAVGRAVASTASLRVSSHTSAEEQGAALAAALAAIACTLEVQATRLSEWEASSAAFLLSMVGRSEAFGVEAAAALAALTSEVQAHAASVDEQLAAQAASITASKVRAEVATEAAAASLLASVHASVSALLSGLKGERDVGTAGLLAGTAHARGLVGGMAQGVCGGLTAQAKAVTEWTATTTQGLHAAELDTAAAARGAQGGVEAGLAGVRAGQGAVAASTAAAKGVADAAAESASGHLTALATSVTAYASRAKSGSVGASDGALSSAEAVGAAAVAAGSRARAFAESVDASGVAVTACAHSAVEEVHGWAGEEGAAVHAFLTGDLREEPITGTTPGKREYVAPAAFLPSSPPANVAKRFRSAKEAGGAATPECDDHAWGSRVAAHARTALQAVSDDVPTAGNGGALASLPSTTPVTTAAAALLSVSAAAARPRAASTSKEGVGVGVARPATTAYPSFSTSAPGQAFPIPAPACDAMAEEGAGVTNGDAARGEEEAVAAAPAPARRRLSSSGSSSSCGGVSSNEPKHASVIMAVEGGAAHAGASGDAATGEQPTPVEAAPLATCPTHFASVPDAPVPTPAAIAPGMNARRAARGGAGGTAAPAPPRALIALVPSNPATVAEAGAREESAKAAMAAKAGGGATRRAAGGDAGPAAHAGGKGGAAPLPTSTTTAVSRSTSNPRATVPGVAKRMPPAGGAGASGKGRAGLAEATNTAQ